MMKGYFLCCFCFLILTPIDAQKTTSKTSARIILDIAPSKLPIEIIGDSIADSRVVYLNAEERNQLHIYDVIGNLELLANRYWISHRLDVSPDYYSLIVQYYEADGSKSAMLINYTTNLIPIDSKKIVFYKDKMIFGSFYFEGDEIKVINRNGGRLHWQFFLLNDKGKMLPFHYQSIKSLQKAGHSMHQRMVKVLNGLIIRDAEGTRIGKYNFGQEVIVESYSKDSLSINDEGKRYRGRRAKVILDLNEYNKTLVVGTKTYRVGYVFEPFLFDIYDDQKGYDDSYTIKSQQDEYYAHPSNSRIGRSDADMRINFDQIFKLKETTLNSFKKKVIKLDSVARPVNYPKEDSVIFLNFKNGVERSLKDTVYMSWEYSPTSDFTLFPSAALEDSYLIYHSFFEDWGYLLLDKNNGDTLANFAEYPFYSPNHKWVICLKTPYSYNSNTAVLQFNKILNGKYVPVFEAEFEHWNLAMKPQVFWLSDTSFVIKATEVSDWGEDQKDKKKFYLKVDITF